MAETESSSSDLVELKTAAAAEQKDKTAKASISNPSKDLVKLETADVGNKEKITTAIVSNPPSSESSSIAESVESWSASYPFCTEITTDNRLNKRRRFGHISSKNEDKDKEHKMSLMTGACRTILECIGEDPDREGLLNTPQRWAKALLFLNKGYNETVEKVTNNAVFDEKHEEMILIRDIDISSLCEHHMLPFTGKLHVGYIPNGKILGLSKFVRISEIFARRLQVQERLTSQIADGIAEAVKPHGVAVVIECEHFCMVMRGVQKAGSKTVTSCVRGCFKTDSDVRSEFFTKVNCGKR